ncbi:outer membrane beta-barrel protein [Rhizobacter sp. P5_C2]
MTESTQFRPAAVAALTVALTLATSVAHAADGGPPLKFSLGGGVTAGGDNLVEGSGAEMDAGRGLQVFAGAEYWVAEPFALQMNLGFQIDRRKAAGGTLRFQRFPLELMGLFAVTNNLRFGAGAQFVFGTKLRGSGDASALNQDYRHATGRVLEGELLITPHSAVKLRYVKENFTPSRDGAPKIKGDHVGLMYTHYF